MLKRLMPIALLAVVFGACRDAFDTTPRDPDAASIFQQAGPLIELQFSEALRIRVNAQGRLQSEVGGDVTGIQVLLDALGVTRIEPVFVLPPDQLEALYADARRLSPGEHIADLMSWYRIELDAGADMAAAINQLLQRPEIGTAYRAPILNVPPPVTPDFTSTQTNYFGAAPSGTENVYARGLTGGRGAGVKLVDLEYDWNFDHEDLLLSPSILITGERYLGFGNDHGTAVLGELVGRDNGIGITGGVPDVIIRVGGVHFNGARDVATAVNNASAQMSPGDVMLIEQQEDMDGNPATSDLVPVEWIDAVYTAVITATQAGRIVVEAAGNGGFNLDNSMFQGKFNRNQRDSRAIFVGAGNDNNARTCCNYGSRLDVQGHGTSVTTSGYGSLYGIPQGLGPNQYYTAGFGGTSGASPIIASAAALLQGYQKHRARPVLTPLGMRGILLVGASPQTGNTAENIGPKPNLRNVIQQLDAAFSATITGSDYIYYLQSTTCTYYASASGGIAPIVYTWSFQYPIQGFSPENGKFIATAPGSDYPTQGSLTVTATDAIGQQRSATKTIWRQPYSPPCT